MADIFYHLGFGLDQLGNDPPTLAVLSGDPGRARWIADDFLKNSQTLSENRGLHSYVGELANGRRIISATSGMGAPSASIVINELVQLGIKTIIRIGTCGSIQDHIESGSVVISTSALVRQGAARDIAPEGYPAVADPFLTVALVEAARELGIDHHYGITASADTFYEGQERTGSSANPHLIRRHVGMTEEFRNLNVLNFEMECGTVFTMGQVYGFTAGCVCGVVAARTEDEHPDMEAKKRAVNGAIRTALKAAEGFA